MKYVLLSAGLIAAAPSGAAAHIESFDVEVAHWFITGASLEPGGVSIVEYDGRDGMLASHGALGPLAPNADGAILQYALEGHIHGGIDAGQVFRVDYDFETIADAGSISVLGGQMIAEAVLPEGSLFATGSLPGGAPMSGFFHTSAMELFGGPIVANHDADEADFVLAINFGWSGVGPADRMSISGSVTITTVPGPPSWAIGLLATGAWVAHARRRR